MKLGQIDNLVRYLSKNWLRGKQKGSELYFACPKCGVGNHFSVNMTSGMWHCFRCDFGGIGLYGSGGLMRKLAGVERVSDSKKTGVVPQPFRFDPDNRGGFGTGVHDEQPKDSFFSFSSADAPSNKNDVWTRQTLLSAEELKRYPMILPSVRGYCERRGIDWEKLADVGAFCAQRGSKLPFLKHSLFYDTIFFPAKDDNGNVIHAVYRPIAAKSKNYVTTGPKPLFPVPHLLHRGGVTDRIVICEGVWDGLSAWQVGYNAVALLGHSIQGRHDLSVFENKRCLIALDGDMPKYKFYQVGERLKGVACGAHLADVPAGKDLNDVLRCDGAQTLRNLVEGSFSEGEVAF